MARPNNGPFKNRPENSPEIPAQSVAYNHFRSMTAAASRVDLSKTSEADLFKNRKSSSTAQWQSEAWEYYDAIGEVKFAFNLVANIVSRIRLYPAVASDPSQVPVAAEDAEGIQSDLADTSRRVLARLDSAFGGQPGLLRDAALNLLVSGEAYLVQVPKGANDRETWDIRSVDEIQLDARGNLQLVSRSDAAAGGSGSGSRSVAGVTNLPSDAFMLRVWRAHPRYSDDPDSSLKGVLDLCAELLLLNRSFRAIERSRLNAGLLFVPDGFSNAANPQAEMLEDDEDGFTQEEEADQFEEDLVDAMTTPIEDEASASAVVPLLLRGPVELGEKIRHIKFSREYDETMIQRAQTVLDRILQGLDVPKDTITGLSQVRYSNAIQIDESLYKAHIEPLLLLLSDALTVGYLRPSLRDLGFPEDEVNKMVVWYDPSSVATRNDRASDADMGYEKHLISGEAWRKSRGFADTDAPSPNELAVRILMENGTFTPEFIEGLFRIINPDVADAMRAGNQATATSPVPGAVNDILNGQPGDPAAPGAPTPGAPGADVAPGEDAPPFPLAEPSPEGEPAPGADGGQEIPAEAVDTEDDQR